MTKAKNFLLIDDDPDDQEFFLEAVKEVDNSIQCQAINTCEEALHLLANNTPVLPDIIFLDLNMPRMDGKTCLAEIKKIDKARHIPVVIYSTSSLKKDIEDTKKLGAVYFLTKPSVFSELCNSISNILETDWTNGLATGN